MTCPICTNKPMNCDCTQADRDLYDLQEEHEAQGEMVERLKAAIIWWHKHLMEVEGSNLLHRGGYGEAPDPDGKHEALIREVIK